MSNSFELSPATRATIAKVLNIREIEDVMDVEYRDSIPVIEEDREKSEKFLARNRGSVRIRAGLFYTAEEHQQRVEKVRTLQLP